MKLEKAIEILQYHEPSLTYDENPDIRQAIKLGIEALQLINQQRLFACKHIIPELPDEDEA